MATLNLHITLTGMFLFVRDPSGAKMHVLAPSTGHDPQGGPHVHDHDPFLVYDLRYEDPFSSSSPKIVPLEEWGMDLSAFTGTGSKLNPNEGVVNLLDLVGRRLDHVQLNRGNARNSVHSLLTLPLANAIEARRPLTTWEIDGQPFELTHQITWIVEGISQAELLLERSRMRGSIMETIATLRPFDPTDPTIRLFFVHLPDGPETTAGPGFRAEHFAAYYRPFRGGHPRGPIPILRSLPPERAALAPAFGGTAFTCMVAQVTPE